MIGDTIEDMEIELEKKHNKIEFLEIKIGLPDSKDTEEKNRFGFNKKSSKRKVIDLWIH